MGELINRYIAEAAPLKKSAANIRQCLNGRRPTFGAYSLAALQPRHIAAYREECLASDKPGATVAKEMKCLSLVIDAAVEDWGFRSRTTPCAAPGCPQPRPEGIGGSRVQEEQAVLSVCAKSRTPMLVAVVLAIETGMRLGELFALDWRDIDTMKRTATLRETKNGESRVVPLSSAALRVLSELPRHISNGRVGIASRTHGGVLWQEPASLTCAFTTCAMRRYPGDPASIRRTPTYAAFRPESASTGVR